MRLLPYRLRRMLGEVKTRLLPTLLVLSIGGGAAIGVHEGYRAKAYKDAVAVQTVGFGDTTREDGTPVQAGDTTTPERALLRLANDAAAMQVQMRQCIGDVPLYQHEWDAYVSLTYNIGTGAFCGSTLVKKLKSTTPASGHHPGHSATPPKEGNDGRGSTAEIEAVYAAACAEILRWDKAGGRVLAGLTKRRQAEYRMCMGENP